MTSISALNHVTHVNSGLKIASNLEMVRDRSEVSAYFPAFVCFSDTNYAFTVIFNLFFKVLMEPLYCIRRKMMIRW